MRHEEIVYGRVGCNHHGSYFDDVSTVSSHTNWRAVRQINDLFHFVKGTEVDPIYFERSYYVAPDSGAEKGYSLLLEAMRKDECLGIARIGMHRREHMLILRPSEHYLVAYTMFYANEVRPAPRFELTTEFSDKELTMATALMK